MIGEVVWDARREVLAVVTGRLGRYWWLRPLGGGREWNAGPDEVRTLPGPGAGTVAGLGADGAGVAAGPARRAVDDALACRLGTTTRADMEHHTRLLRVRAEALLGAGVAGETAELVRALLDAAPSREDPAHAAYAHMQALARLLRHHSGEVPVAP
ncbi:LuxR family transcriptional regulator [Streptomyces sp. SID11385]|uniref:LuxR family transcriptional regulator n=1 Tax=Streptomyces sp. SID11385 TaxID=2706031 RepID=UPI0031BA8780